MTAAIVVVVPVLARPQNAQTVAQSLELSDPDGLCRLLFVCSPGDDRQIRACHQTGAQVLMVEQPAGHGDFARKIQAAYQVTSEPFLFQAADDVTFEPGWAERALYAIEKGAGFGVCGTWDGANPLVMRGRHSTHSLIRRTYIEEPGASWDGPGSVFSLAYRHQSVDVELVELAKARRLFTFAREARVIHRHPFFDRSVPMDDTYRKALADGAHDRKVFVARRREWTKALAAA